MAYELIPVPAFRDNYIWLMAGAKSAAVVDPGDAAPVRKALEERHLMLAAILITHHHADHMGGAAALALQYGCPVYGPAGESIEAVTEPLHEGQEVNIPRLEIDFNVLEIPGHTAGHIAFCGNNIVFCGDTLFSAGCGRLFEGTAAQMSRSLGKLAALPDSTAICCGHEYTMANLRFARVVEPGNRDIMDYATEAAELRSRNLPTLPSTLGRERSVNPFLRCDTPAVVTAAQRHAGHALQGPIEVFAVIRSWKDIFT
ncbi:MAG TPA: hydroxyacylglutathione hydrolase [Gammaproteobacteria bacterium]|nr:hydroxyacylglutathione hydrolase [Gammaproteobacteria bacterium]